MCDLVISGRCVSHIDFSKTQKDENERGDNMSERTEAYQRGREDAARGKGGNPWAGSSDSCRWDDYEDGQRDEKEAQAEKETD